MKNFIAGMLFVAFVDPILEAIGSLIVTGLEIIKAKWGLKITEYNHQIQKLGDEPINSNVIGFVAPTVEEEDYDYDEED